MKFARALSGSGKYFPQYHVELRMYNIHMKMIPSEESMAAILYAYMHSMVQLHQDDLSTYNGGGSNPFHTVQQHVLEHGRDFRHHQDDNPFRRQRP